MHYDHILIRFGEMSLKGKNRSQFVNTLRRNVNKKLTGFDNIQIRQTRDRMFIELNGEDHEKIAEKLQEVFGIHSFSLALKTGHDMEEIKEGALAALRQANPDAATFKITAKRAYKPFPTGSQEMNQILGGHILKNSPGIKVDVHHPDVEVRVEIREKHVYITTQYYKGAGGLPVGTGGRVLLMLSGGIDSPVAGYLTMKRGVKVEAIHFHSPPFTSERSKQKVVDLSRVLTKYGGKVKLHVVPFTEVQKEINKHIPANYSMTIMRRIMLRIAETLARKNGILAIATGESLGQVASQTLQSMNTINAVTNYPIIRPLVGMDKIEIMDISQKIGTYDISIRPYEDCCTVFLPANPKTKPKLEHAERFEQAMEIDRLVQEAVEGTEVLEFKEKQETISEEFEDLF